MSAEVPESEPIILVRGLRKTYRSLFRRERIRALEGIDLEVHPGEIFGFLGPNGAGKTTTVKLLLGLLRPDSGTIRILGGEPGSLAVKRRIGYMPERSILPPYLRLAEMLRLFAGLSGLRGAARDAAVHQAIHTVDLGPVAHRTLDGFSKGMLQRASLAQALLGDPDLLLLDEPAIGLDPVGRHKLRELFKRVRDQGRTIFLNSHELEVVQIICDRFAILDRGRILATEPIGKLRDLSRYSIELGTCPPGPERLVELLGPAARWIPQDRLILFEGRSLAEINQVVDRIRGTGTEIVSLNPHTISLEELFLRYFAAGTPGSPA